MMSLEAIPTVGSNFSDLVRELKQIWTEIGESKEDKHCMMLELERECMLIYQRKIEEASSSRAYLHQSVAAKEAEVAALIAALGEQNLQLKMDKRLSLKEQLASVNPLLEDLRKKREERLKQFADIQSQIQKINAEIADDQCHSQANAVKVEEADLSIRKLTEYQLQLQSLQKDKSDRLHKVLECVNEVHSLCGVLGVDFGKTVDSVHPSLHHADGRNFTNISDSTIEDLSQVILKLKTEKKIRTAELLEVSESLLELWNLMETPDEERKHFGEVICILGSPENDIGLPGVLSLETIKEMEAEVERLTNLKAARMKELVLKKRTELEEICRDAHIEPDMNTTAEKVSALIDSGIVDSSGLLATIEMQILEAKEESRIRKEIMDRINKWLAACEEENWLEEYDQDENRYSAGRGAHLNLKRAEKARVTVSKIPDMVDKLMNKIFVWEKDRSMPFLYDGVPLVSILEEYKLLRLQKEELKRRYRDQKKLHNLFPSGKEAVYGSKPNPRRSNSFNRKTNENGTMTPTRQRVYAGSPTTELLMQRSYSGDYDGYLKEMRRLSSTSLNFASISKEDTMSSITSHTSSEPGSPPLN
ncbi:65-kDa microtubule-associated protein 6-like [Canna indica]|uniref:65-kDa microtubule-associated protein 6-like n=1 Tax=Canna indica TaxID=4628 RepID=A0AAQ3JZT1_9LILI|nr:65-kDa microtubule-associated protein 6-like [Canna indica]